MTAATVAHKLGGLKVLKSSVKSELDLAALIRQGLPSAALDHMLNELAASAESGELYRLVGSMRTLQRKRAARDRLSVDESDRLARVARLVVRAEETMGDAAKAHTWLGRPNRALAGHRPLSLLDSDAGTQAVERVLGRIEHGVYS
jgi:putative toxin-antitoxin system antitoxin component (TIGR02293 family)